MAEASSDPFHLERFVIAQQRNYLSAIQELQRGHKRSHWIWYIFPQLKGLGFSRNSEFYGLSGAEEACAYAAHPILGPRLREAVATITSHPGRSAALILGHIDAMKLRSCLTLFSIAVPEEPLFAAALSQFFDHLPDERTIEMLRKSS
jgi:uncharacterized protein (DUF1810 family)